MVKIFKWLIKYYKRHPKVVVILLVVTPIHAAIAVIVPRLIGFTVDYIKTDVVDSNWIAQLVYNSSKQFDISATTGFALVFILLGIVSSVLYAYFQSWRAWMNLRLEWHFRQDSFSHSCKKGPNFFNRFRTGDLVTRMTDDVAEKLSWFACSGIFRTYEASLGILFVILMMLTIDPILTLWTAGPLPILILIFFKTSSLLEKRYDRLQSRISRFNDTMEAVFSGIRVIKAYVREDAQKQKFHNAAVDRRHAEIDSVKMTRIVDSLYNYIWQIGVVIVLLAGGYRVLYSDLSLGELASAIYYVTWLIFPMFDIGQFLVKSRQSAVSINRLLELEDVPPMVAEVDSGLNGTDCNGELSLQNVSFMFPDSDRDILKDVTLDIKSGSTVAFVGRVGAGKSWLVNMIPRLVDPTTGSIKLDGSNIQEYDLEYLRSQIGYVPQEPVLFSDTVKNNIIFGRTDISEDEIDWAVDTAQLADEIKRFPNGIETEIGVRGMSISGGQKQRLALARALIGKPSILILDDCTSALDSQTEARLWDRLHDVLPTVTALLITHRPGTLEKVDDIFVLQDGKVVQTGKHHDLISQAGEYASIYKKYKLEEAVTN